MKLDFWTDFGYRHSGTNWQIWTPTTPKIGGRTRKIVCARVTCHTRVCRPALRLVVWPVWYVRGPGPGVTGGRGRPVWGYAFWKALYGTDQNGAGIAREFGKIWIAK